MRPWLSCATRTSKAPDTWADTLEIHPSVANLLWQRGVETLDEANAFLSPNLRHLAPSTDLCGVAEAAKLLYEATQAKKRVLIWGDYDVDGITGACLMHQVLCAHGVDAQVHLPERESEGYGLNVEGIEHYAAQGFDVLLTVDCGISDAAAIECARSKGMLSIITDHHMPPEQIPHADAICNPRIHPDGSCTHLAGVGVAFFLMRAFCALHSDKPPFDMREVLDIVALGTLADMVHLSPQNRIITKNGLLKIAEANRPGIAALKEISKFSPKATLGSSQVVFNLAPRINAAGRLGQPTTALQLLSTTSRDEAHKLAKALDTLNRARRAEEDTIFEEALKQYEAEKHRAGLVLFAPHWHQGIIGIVASRIVEVAQRPVLILCQDNEVLKGSGRSMPDFDLHASLQGCDALLLGYGGHKQAAGLRLLPENLPALKERFDELVTSTRGKDCAPAPLHIDAELGFDVISDFIFLKSLELLQPFGMGNAEPVFSSMPLKVTKQRAFGPLRNHVLLEVQEVDSGITLQAKAWRIAKTLPTLTGQVIRLVFTPSINTYNGVASVELRLIDWKFDV